MDKKNRKFIDMFDLLEKMIPLARDGFVDWDVVYDFLFNSLYPEMQAIHRIDYYDPDATYEDDVMAYYNAAEPIAKMLKGLS